MTTKSNAWVTTGGQYRGVMKMVGQALKDVYDDQGNHVPCIGFCQWGFMRDNKKLVNNGGKIVRYNAVDKISDDKTCVSLEPNHTHFVIVDNGIEKQEYGEYELYNEVKKAMKKGWSGAFFLATAWCSQINARVTFACLSASRLVETTSVCPRLHVHKCLPAFLSVRPSLRLCICQG